MIFDTHAHYDDHAFDEDRDAVLSSLAEAGVGRVLDVGASVRSLRRVVSLTEKYSFVYGAVGLHPDEVGIHARAAQQGLTYEPFSCSGREDENGEEAAPERKVAGLTEEVLADLKLLLALPKIVAVGEIGLDYHWDTEPHDVQMACFRKQMELAVELGKPILVHSRSAAADTMRMIESVYGNGRPAAKMAKAEAERNLQPWEYEPVPGKEWVWRKVVPKGIGAELPGKGIIHAYAYSAEQAGIYTGMGFLLGIGGVLTYKNSRKLKKVVSEIPLTSLVLETDCPYLAPEPFRGERNDSRKLHEVAAAIAEIKGITKEEVIETTWRNACALFGMEG